MISLVLVCRKSINFWRR